MHSRSLLSEEVLGSSLKDLEDVHGSLLKVRWLDTQSSLLKAVGGDRARYLSSVRYHLSLLPMIASVC